MIKVPAISKELVEYLESLVAPCQKETAPLCSPADVAIVNFNRGRLQLTQHLRQLHDKQYQGKVIPDVH
jgi:hypothetical protein